MLTWAENQPLVLAYECRGKALEEGNEKCYSREHIDDKKAKQPSVLIRESFSDLDRRSNQPPTFP